MGLKGGPKSGDVRPYETRCHSLRHHVDEGAVFSDRPAGRLAGDPSTHQLIGQLEPSTPAYNAWPFAEILSRLGLTLPALPGRPTNPSFPSPQVSPSQSSPSR